MKKTKIALILLMLSATMLLGHMYMLAKSDPVIRQARFAVQNWPSGAAPLRIALISDIHVAGPDMPPERLDRLVQVINAQDADIVLFAGDFVSDKMLSTTRYTAQQAIAPLRNIKAKLGSAAVLGNHDHWRNATAMRAAFLANGIIVLDNDAIRFGPISIGGLDDSFTGHADIGAMLNALRPLGGVPIILSHSPDVFPEIPKDIRIGLAGHTHCGQISLPFVGARVIPSRFGQRYACGIVQEGDQRFVITAGLGTSILPLRLGIPPDFWIIQLGPEAGS